MELCSFIEKLKKHRYYNSVLQFIKFCIVGVINTTISLVVYYIFLYINPSLYLLGSIVGFVVSTLNAYILNSRFVFFSSSPNNHDKKVIIKTYLAYILGLGVQTGLLYVLVDLSSVNAEIAPVLTLLVTVPLNFVTNKFWVHKLPAK